NEIGESPLRTARVLPAPRERGAHRDNGESRCDEEPPATHRRLQFDVRRPSNQSHSRYTITVLARLSGCFTGMRRPTLTSTCCRPLRLTCSCGTRSQSVG